MYTLNDYEAAKEELAGYEKAWEEYMGNNPDKYRSQIQQARSKVRHIEEELKTAGLLPMSEEEAFNKKLDTAFPDTQHKEVVEFEGCFYQRVYYPLAKSRSGKTVAEWGKDWRKTRGPATEKPQKLLVPTPVPQEPEPPEYVSYNEVLAACHAWLPKANPKHNAFNNLLSQASNACDILAQVEPVHREELLAILSEKVTEENPGQFKMLVVGKWEMFYGGKWPRAKDE